MITVKLNGGLGNQMFQYAAGRALAAKHDTSLKIDISSFGLPNQTKRSYALENFKLNATVKQAGLLSKVLEKLQLFSNRYVEKSITYDKNFDKLNDGTVLVGHWQSPKYFHTIDDKIRSELTLKIKPILPIKIEKVLKQRNTVAIHVRRGDYVTDPMAIKILGALPANYYCRAIELIGKKVNNPYYVVISDDIDWCHKNLAKHLPHNNSTYFSKDQLTDFYLLTKTTHNIIANSSFSWWGAWLNQNLQKIVIGPKHWFKDKNFKSNDLFPDSWLRV